MPLPVDNQLPHVVPVANPSRHRCVARLAAAGLVTPARALHSSGVFAQDATPVPKPEATPKPEEILPGSRRPAKFSPLSLYRLRNDEITSGHYSCPHLTPVAVTPGGIGIS